MQLYNVPFISLLIIKLEPWASKRLGINVRLGQYCEDNEQHCVRV